FVDRVYGELFRPLEIVPPVAVDLSETAFVFPSVTARSIEVPVRSNSGKQAGDVRLEVPTGWTDSPARQHFQLGFTDEQTTVTSESPPQAGASKATVPPVARAGTAAVSTGLKRIDSPHIPIQMLLPVAQSALVRTNITNLSKNVGYVMGAGDEVPNAIRQLGA